MYPSLYQLNTRTYLSAIARGATLDDIPESLLEHLENSGFEWMWLLGVWQIGATGAQISRTRAEWRNQFIQVLPDLTDADICGSPFAVCEYTTDACLGGDAALARIRKRLANRGIKLLLDFIPNHVGFDHPWVGQHPEFLITGSETQLRSNPDTWTKLPDGRIIAFGRDPNFPGWPDTLQLNYFNPKLRLAVLEQLQQVATKCDGVRCDMAMLIEPEVFRRTWELRAPGSVQGFESVWPKYIEAIRAHYPDFVFMAEVYWDYEYKLQQHGFDFTYDKTLYDRMLERHASKVRAHLIAPLSYQAKMVRFLENHDEERIASKLSLDEHLAAAVLTYFTPGMRFFFDGQCEGKRTRIPVHLARAPREKEFPEVRKLYEALMPLIQSPPNKHGAWHLIDALEAWPENVTHENFIAFLIEHPLQTLLVASNYAPYRSQCFLKIPERPWVQDKLVLRDLLSIERLVRPVSDVLERGLFLDCAGWQTHIFEVDPG